MSATIEVRALARIAITCPRLQKLNIRYCRTATSSGVQNIVQNCEMLTEINKEGCTNVRCRPSLRKMYGFWWGFIPTEEQYEVFLRNGRVVVNRILVWFSILTINIQKGSIFNYL